MRFSLFGFETEIQFGFWLTAGLLGLPLLSTELPKPIILVWMGVVFVSVLVHELGHAFAIRRHSIEPAITLHMMGGTTSWHPNPNLTRGDRILISLAGPFAGFALGAAIYAVLRIAGPGAGEWPILVQEALGLALWVNVAWGVINLLPVLPFDGGHVLEEAMGPERAKTTAAVSFTIGVGVTLLFLAGGHLFAAFIFGMAAVQSYQRYRAEPENRARTSQAPSSMRPPPVPPPDVEMAPMTRVTLKRAKDALANEEPDRAVELAELVLSGREVDEENPSAPSPFAARQALEVVAWAHLLKERAQEAAQVHSAAANLGHVDPALTAAIHMAFNNLPEARRILEQARASGDDRKEVAGPLIQILLGQGEVARGAAVAFDIVDNLSSEDARRVAQIAFSAGAYDWAARLWEVTFERDREAEDAYEAARAHAQDGAQDRALELLRRAVDAGFSDRARAWSDAALETLRVNRGLEAVLPRP